LGLFFAGLLTIAACASSPAPQISAVPAPPSSQRVAGPAPASPSEAKAREYIALLSKGKFDEATAWGDDTIHAKVPAAKLTEIWSHLVAEEGPFVRQGDSRERAREKDGGAVVQVECEFRRGMIEVTVTVAGDGRVAGLWFGPHQVKWEPPTYADKSAFTERELSVGGAPKLSATLTLPVKTKAPDRPPIVVLVHGSGPNDRDESSGGSKLFRDLAWGLASRGIAVLRYDKRTHQYRGSLTGKAITYDDETVDDARIVLRDAALLPEVDPARVFLVGHSLGACLAPRIATGTKVVAGLVLLAGSTRPFDQLLRDQTRYLLGLRKASDDDIAEAVKSLDEAFARARGEGPPGEVIEVLRSPLPRSYIRDQLTYDPVRGALAVDLPMLVMQGERDYQVTAAQDFAGWQRGLSSKSNVTFKLYPGLNHYFVFGKGTPGPAEYATPGHADEHVIADIESWVLATKRP
jgi:alpha-beta hydrolase superfamily lysophospholipase